MPRCYAPIIRDNFKHYQPNGSFSQGELISGGYLPPLNQTQYLPFPQEPIEASGSNTGPLPSQQTDIPDIPDKPPTPLTLNIKYPSPGPEGIEDNTRTIEVDCNCPNTWYHTPQGIRMAPHSAIKNPFEAGSTLIIPSKPCQLSILLGELEPIVTVMRRPPNWTSGAAMATQITLSNAQANILLLTLPKAITEEKIAYSHTPFSLLPLTISNHYFNNREGLKEGTSSLIRSMQH
ncbi:hypothetical protein FRC11_004197 [Ceratobasidium sp. 423]|nr:hypothetical protein FRC11_004197 [Ceratobasidium sp. 423]